MFINLFNNDVSLPGNTTHLPSVSPMLDQRRRWCANIGSSIALVKYGIYSTSMPLTPLCIEMSCSVRCMADKHVRLNRLVI